MRTPVVMVCGQGDADAVVDVLVRTPGTVVIGHRFDGQVVVRAISTWSHGNLSRTELPLEISNGCVTCTIRNDLLVLLRQLPTQADVRRVVVRLPPWLEAQPICSAIADVAVRIGAGQPDGPAIRDVRIDAVVTCVDSTRWLWFALGEDVLDDGRTAAQVVVRQAEFADVLVLTEPDATTLAVLRRLAPRARITVGPDRIEMALRHLEPGAPRGRIGHPLDPLLAGEPPLSADGDVAIVEFSARRPFHPQRLHAAMALLLRGVVRARGRAWLANKPDDVMWVESAGGGLRFGHAGRWLAAMDGRQLAYIDPERRALAAVDWDDRFGDRHVSMTVLVCGARPAEIVDGLGGALLTDDEFTSPTRWANYQDPFGDWHEDPCDDLHNAAGDIATGGGHDADDR